MHNQFYITERVSAGDDHGDINVLATDATHTVGQTYSHSPHPDVPGTTDRIIAGPFDLPEPMPHVLAVQRWLRLCKPDLYAEYFDTSDPYVTEQVEGQIMCDQCGEFFTPTTPEFEDTEYGTLPYFQHTERICSEECLHEYVYAFRTQPRPDETEDSPDEPDAQNPPTVRHAIIDNAENGVGNVVKGVVEPGFSVGIDCLIPPGRKFVTFPPETAIEAALHYTEGTGVFTATKGKYTLTVEPDAEYPYRVTRSGWLRESTVRFPTEAADHISSRSLRYFDSDEALVQADLRASH